MDSRVRPEPVEGVEFPAQLLLRKFFMNKGMAASADVDASLAHVRLVKMFTKPFVTVAGLGDEMVKGNQCLAATESADFVGFFHTLPVPVHCPDKTDVVMTVLRMSVA